LHEISVMNSVVAEVIKIMEERGFKGVEKIVLDVGALTFLNEEALKFAFDVIKEDLEGFSGAELVINIIPAEVLCENCGYRGDVNVEEDSFYHFALPTLKCPRCGSEVRIVGGRDCVIRKITFLS